MLTFHKVYAGFKRPQMPITDPSYRYHGFQTNGELPQIPNERSTEGALVASRVSRRSDSSGLWIQKLTRIANVLMATEWSLTRTQYAMNETWNPIDKAGRGNTRGVEVQGITIGIESMFRLGMFGEEGKEAGIIDEMIMRAAAGVVKSGERLSKDTPNMNYDAMERMHHWRRCTHFESVGKG